MAAERSKDGIQLLVSRQIATLQRRDLRVKYLSNSLGHACFRLDLEQVRAQLAELTRCGLTETSLTHAAEIEPMQSGTTLSPKDRKMFHPEVGSFPLHLVCLACARDLELIRHQQGLRGDASRSASEREVQAKASKTVELLVAAGANINARDAGPIGSTALHTAARGGCPHLLSALLRHGADVDARAVDGSSAEIFAHRAGRVTCEEILQVVAASRQEALGISIEDLDTGRVPSASSRNGGYKEDKVRQGGAQGQGGQNSRNRQPAKGKRKTRGGPRADGDPASQEDTSGGSIASLATSEDNEEPTGNLAVDPASLRGPELRALVEKLREERRTGLQELCQLTAEQRKKERDLGEIEQKACLVEKTVSDLREQEWSHTSREPMMSSSTPEEAKACKEWQAEKDMYDGLVAHLETTLQAEAAKFKEQKNVFREEIQNATMGMAGLESVWDDCCEARVAIEKIELRTSQQHFADLVEEISQMATSLCLSDELVECLPQLASFSKDLGGSISPSSELIYGLKIHQELQDVRRQQEQEVLQLTNMSNTKIARKDAEIERVVHDVVTEDILHSIDGWYNEDPWMNLSKVVAMTKQNLKAMAKTSLTQEENVS